MSVLRYLAGSALLVVLLTGCMHNEASSGDSTRDNVPSTFVPPNSVKVVNGALHAILTRGDWLYQGARAHAGAINAYVEVPAAMPMNDEQMRAYIEFALCGQLETQSFWHRLQNTPLRIHLRRVGSPQGVAATCPRPNESAT
ncbi:hypothetical protein [Bowmanella sp. JS7-9]|uniref:Lipoprotein n=1 Tax=Pseudobowmanella zhangzhouensis TaxID=1537679 RepID=A0ABW1XK22_9ALTE|nr:hypothetical protein [Bowmanella sp. JS7-9]TBX22473.1 hypothetical protein TK45_08405 [Bowmanella sp. JS7-9]